MKLLRKKSGIIIIGNEILSGKTLDRNSNFLCKRLLKKGIDVQEVSIIPDIKKIIIEKINLFRKKFDYVFTTGGIGPTHDDITSRSIAEAFNVDLVLNNEARKRLEKHYSDDVLTKARLKMAFIPKTAKLIDNPVSIAPGFYIGNVFVFPGVPKIFQIMIDQFFDKIDKGNKYYQKNVTTILSEGLIGEFIEKVQKKFISIEIGSYPYFKKNSFGVSLIIKGDKKKEVEKASIEIFNYLKFKNGSPRLF